MTEQDLIQYLEYEIKTMEKMLRNGAENIQVRFECVVGNAAYEKWIESREYIELMAHNEINMLKKMRDEELKIIAEAELSKAKNNGGVH